VGEEGDDVKYCHCEDCAAPDEPETCPHDLLIADEDCPDCPDKDDEDIASEADEGDPNPHGNHDRWEEVRGER
jgi:hypothetical protein